jgi:eukaryotic-like serine/threonine-protein kinase
VIPEAKSNKAMTPKQWELVREVLYRVLERPASERSDYLDEVCGADSELRLQVESLIRSSASDPGIVPSNVFEVLRLRPGTKIDQFDIVSLLGSGGMGEVYRARDTQLGREVAIKILPPAFAEHQDRLRRFEQEARSAAALNHPNIMGVHQFGHYREQPYLVTELVEGHTLREEMLTGALPLDLALRYAMDMVRGLAAAHEKGIIHRDLKPENLMVTADGRIKILDFGLAKLSSESKDPENLLPAGITASGVIVGTLRYMSPEQLRGAQVDARTDIYAAGAVLYEMCAGKRVFAEEQSAELISAILQSRPQSPRIPNPRIPMALASVILKCLEKDAAKRYQSAAELLRALEAVPGTLKHTAKLWTAVAVALLLAAAFLAAYVLSVRQRPFHRQPAAEQAAARAQPRRSVAVLGFKNVSGRHDADWLSTGIAEMLTTELGTGNQTRTVAAETVARAKRDLAISDADTLAGDTLAHLRQSLGADYIVLGSYVNIGQGKQAEVRLDARVQDAATGETLGLVSETGKEDQLFDLVTGAGEALREKLGIAALSATETEQIRALVPAAPEASRLYAEGLSELRNFNPTAARNLLEKAVAKDPNFALAHSALADAWTALGYDERAAAEAKRALEASRNLDREQHLLVEAHYYQTARKWAQAIESYRGLWAFAPDNGEYGLSLAQSQAAAGQGKEALNTVAALRRLPPPISDDPRIDLAEEAAARGLSDFKRALAASVAATEKGKGSQSQSLVARAELAQSRSYYSLGDLDHARQAAEEARRLFAASGDQSGEAAALHSLATVLSDKGDNTSAKQMHEQALATCRKVGNQRCVADALNSIGVILKDQAAFSGARQAYQQSLAIRREIGDRSGEAISLNNIAVVFYQQGHLSNASRMYERALAIARGIGEKRGIARALTNLGIVLEERGRLTEARQVQEESIALRRQIADRQGLGIALNNYAVLMQDLGDLAAAEKAIDEQLTVNRDSGNQRGLAYALFIEGNILMAQDKLEEAKRIHQEALAIRDKIGEKTTAEESRVSLAKLSLTEGHLEVESTLREVLGQALIQKEPEIETFARITLANALVKLGRPGDAAKEIGPAEAMAETSEARLHRIDVFISAAQVHAALGERATAERMLASALSESAQLGCIRCQLESRLAQAELKSRSQGKSASAMIASLTKDASQLGFLLLARQAASLNHQP